jgi:hypothetical protein
MGQPVAVKERKGSRPGLVRFELNRSLTGMGHERFLSPDDAVGPRPSAELARRLFATGQVDAVHVYQNIVTVDVKKGFTSDGLGEIVEELYLYYRPGVELPTFDDTAVAEETPAAAAAAPAEGGGEAPKVSALASKIPAHLLERARVAKQRWREKQGG